MIEVDWVPIDQGTYHAIYATALKNETRSVFGTHTCMEGCEWHSEPRMLTEWGFKGSPVPLIRSIKDGDRWSYWIAKVIES